MISKKWFQKKDQPLEHQPLGRDKLFLFNSVYSFSAVYCGREILLTTNKRTTNGARSLWSAILADLQLQVTRPVFETWLAGTRGVKIEKAHLVVEAPSPFVVEALERRLFTIIETSLFKISGKHLSVVFEVKKISTGVYPLSDNKTTAPSFDNFIVGPSNKIAYTTTKTIANEPLTNHSPLYLYSDPGLGKTHLMQAICSNVEKKRKTPVYVSAEEFTHDFVTSIQKGADTPRIFRQKYRTPDILLVDDIQFLIGKKKTIDVFLNTLTSRILKNQAVVLAGDRPPSHFISLDSRLTSVLAGGLAINISTPDKATVKTILKKTCQSIGLKLSATVENYINDNPPSNTRALIGFLKTLLVFQKNQKTPISIIETKRILSEISGPSAPNTSFTLNPDELLIKISESFGVSLEILKSPSRDRISTEARHSAMYVLRKKTSLTLREIGLILGGRNHTSVALAINKIKKNPTPAVLNLLK